MPHLPLPRSARSAAAFRASPLGAWLLRRRRERARLRRVAERAALSLRRHSRRPHERFLFDRAGRAQRARDPETYLTPASVLPDELAALFAAQNQAIRLGRHQQARLSRLIAARAAELHRAKLAFFQGRNRAPD